MRTLPSDLVAAQRAGTGRPVVRLTARDALAGLPRLRYTRHYTGSEDDRYHAAVCAGDGSLVRARVSTGSQLYLQVTAAPGAGSAFGAWTALGAVAGVALAASGATVLLFYVETDQVTVRVRESADNGVTFGGAVTAVTASGAAGWLAAGISGGGVVRLFYTVGATVYVASRTGGVWGAPTAWPNTAANITGLACVYQLDWDLAVAGTDPAGNSHLWTCVLGDGYDLAAGAWSGLTAIASASSGSGVNFQAPFLDFSDGYRLWFVERYTGGGGYSRPHWSYQVGAPSFLDALWLEPAPFDLTAAYGVAAAHDGAAVWLSTPFGVWQAARVAPLADLSAHVLDLHLTDRPFGGGLTAMLRGAAPAALAPGAELTVDAGYRTGAGDRLVTGPRYWVRSVVSQVGPAMATVAVAAGDAWWLLEQWRARQQFAWAAGQRNLFQLLSFVLARAGLSLAAFSASPQLTGLSPAFIIQPGGSGIEAVRRLLDMAPDLLFFDGGAGYLVNPLVTDPSAYSYGPAAHGIRQAAVAATGPAFGQAQVFGAAGVYGEAFDWTAVDTWHSAVHKVRAAGLTTLGDAGDRAVAELRRAAVFTDAGHITVAANLGQQLYDVVDLTVPSAGLDAALRRVTGLDLHYRRGVGARYETVLHLGGV